MKYFFLFIFALAAVTRTEETEGGPGRPNILFCTADDASSAHVGAVAQERLSFMRAYTAQCEVRAESCVYPDGA